MYCDSVSLESVHIVSIASRLVSNGKREPGFGVSASLNKNKVYQLKRLLVAKFVWEKAYVQQEEGWGVVKLLSSSRCCGLETGYPVTKILTICSITSIVCYLKHGLEGMVLNRTYIKWKSYLILLYDPSITTYYNMIFFISFKITKV